jgi:hypothetical protein
MQWCGSRSKRISGAAAKTKLNRLASAKLMVVHLTTLGQTPPLDDGLNEIRDVAADDPDQAAPLGP